MLVVVEENRECYTGPGEPQAPHGEHFYCYSNDTTQGLASHRHHTVNLLLVVAEKEQSNDAIQGLAGHRHEILKTLLVDVDLEKEVSH